MLPLPLRTQAAARLAIVAADISRRSGRGGGSVIGGRLALGVDGNALRRLAQGRTVVLVSGTNGKTTTTRMIAAALGQQGTVATNTLGANMPAGLVTALAAAPAAQTAVLEVDERYLPTVLDEVQPVVVTLLNLSRDQLDRVGEVAMVSGSWRRAVAAYAGTVVANADDPLVAAAARAAARVVWVSAGQVWRGDAELCLACGSGLQREGDDWWCSCGVRRPATEWQLDGHHLVAAGGQRHPLQLALPGRANRANAAMAAAVAAQLGVPPEVALESMGEITSVAGRYTTLEVEGRHVRLLLAKNPAGWLETCAVLAPPPTPVVLGLNAQAADGRDPSWLYDLPVDALRGRQVVVCGERRLDLAVRLHYGGVTAEVAPTGRSALLGVPVGPVDIIANYTAFNALRGELARAA